MDENGSIVEFSNANTIRTSHPRIVRAEVTVYYNTCAKRKLTQLNLTRKPLFLSKTLTTCITLRRYV